MGRLSRVWPHPIAVVVVLSALVASVSSVALVGPGEQSGSSGSLPEPPGVREAIATGLATVPSEKGVYPAASTLTYYNWSGYNGNSTIYPTEYTTATPLPLLSKTAYQTQSNASIAVANILTLKVANETWAEPRFGDLGEGFNDDFAIWVWLVATGGSQQYGEWPDGCDDPANDYLTSATDLAVAPSGLPSANTNEFQAGNDTGLNLTTGNTGAQGNDLDLLLPVTDAALSAAALVFPELAAIQIANIALDMSKFAGAFGPTSSTAYQSNIDVAGDSTANQWGLVDNGTIPICGQSSLNQNVFSQAVYSQNTFGPTYLADVTPGTLEFSAGNELEFADGAASSQDEYAEGSNVSFGYPIMPAASIGGIIYLYNNSACYPNCPRLPGATTTVQEFYEDGAQITNYVQNSGPAGNWHFFMDPQTSTGCVATPYSYWASWTSPLGAVAGNTSSLPCAAQAEGGDTETLSDSVNGGAVTGKVLGNDGPTWGGVSGASVSLCNNQGCVYTTSKAGGSYTFEFPVAGTSSDPYSITVNVSGRPQTSVGGLTLPVGVTTNLNVRFTPTYSATFTESGAPSGSWSVTLESQKKSATVPSSIVFTESNGTLTFSVGAITGYTPSPSTGSVTVSGANVSQAITFSANSYTVTFSESGLPSGTTWSVTLGSSSKSASSGSSISFGVSTGSYSFSVPDADEKTVGCELEWYQPSPSSGTISVPNTLSEKITFTFEEKASVASPSCTSLSRVPSGLLGSPPAILSAALVVVIISGTIIIAWPYRSIHRMGQSPGRGRHPSMSTHDPPFR